MFKGSFIEVSSVFQEYVRDIARVCQGYFKSVPMCCKDSLKFFFSKGVSRMFLLVDAGLYHNFGKKNFISENFWPGETIKFKIFLPYNLLVQSPLLSWSVIQSLFSTVQYIVSMQIFLRIYNLQGAKNQG